MDTFVAPKSSFMGSMVSPKAPVVAPKTAVSTPATAAVLKAPSKPSPLLASVEHLLGGAASAVGNVASKVFAGPIERAGAVVQSVKQGSLAPLEQSFADQFKEMGAPVQIGTGTNGKTGQKFAITMPKAVHDLVVSGGIGEGGLAEEFGGGLHEPSIPSGKGSTVPPGPEAALPPSAGEILGRRGVAPSTDVPPVGESVSSPHPSTVNLGINPDTMQLDETGQKTLDLITQDLAPKTKAKLGTMSNQEVIDFAKANPNLNLGEASREASLKANAAILQAREHLTDVLNNGGTNEDVIRSFMQVKTNLADLGRSLQAVSIKAEPVTNDSALPSLLSKILKVNDNVDEIITAAKDVDFNDYNQAVTFYRQFVKPEAADWIDMVRYNSMLSSPKTLSNISLGNAMNTVMQPVVKTTAGAFDWLKSAVTRGEQTHFMTEGPAYAKGAITAVGKAAQNFTDVMTGNLDPKMLDFSIPIATEGNLGTFVKAMNFFSTLHNAMYQFFNTIDKGGELGALATKEAKGIHIPFPDDVAQAAADYTSFRAGLNPEGQGTLLNSIDSLSGLIKQARNSANPVTSWTAKLTFPFMTIATNIAKQMVEYSPAGFATIPGSADAITQFSKAFLGTAGMAAIASMASSGNMTGPMPINAKEKNAFLASGRQPYSIKIGNTWVGYNKLPPALSFPMVLGATYVEALRSHTANQNALDDVLATAAGGIKFFADESYIKNMGDLWAAVQGDTQRATSLLAGYTQQFIPFRAFSGWLATLMDPEQRQIDSSKSAIEKQFDSFMMQVPGLRETIPARLDANGNPIPHQNRIANAFNPLPTTEADAAGEESYKNFGVLSVLGKNASADSADIKSQAQQTWDQMKQTDPATAKAQLKMLATTNPELAKEVLAVIKSGSTSSLTPTEQKLQNSSVAARAQFIVDQKSNYQTADEYKAYLKDLADKKILTKATLDKVVALLGTGSSSDVSKVQAPAASGAKTKTTEPNIIDTVLTYAKALGTDPLTAFERIFTGQRILRVDNGAIIVERMPFAASTAQKKADAGGGSFAGMNLDHTIPLELGGSNDKGNLKLVPQATWESYTPVEDYLGAKLKAGDISKAEAQREILGFKAGTITREQIIGQ